MYSILYKHKLLNTEVLLETSLRSVDHRGGEGVCYMRREGRDDGGNQDTWRKGRVTYVINQ